MGAITQREIEQFSINLFKKMGLISDDNISTHTFKVEDYVYCYDEEIGNIPCIVKEVKGNFLILSDGFETFEANASNCKLQSED